SAPPADAAPGGARADARCAARRPAAAERCRHSALRGPGRRSKAHRRRAAHVRPDGQHVINPSGERAGAECRFGPRPDTRPSNAYFAQGASIMTKEGFSRPALIGAGLSLALILAFYILREHWGHVLGALPYLLLLACPLLHLFHGHGGHSGHR